MLHLQRKRKIDFRRTLAFLSLLVAWAVAVDGGQFHVRPEGSPFGDGSPDRPWDLQTALNNGLLIQPGDTVWLHGGTYRGSFESNLSGTASAPVVVRSYPGEWAIIDNGGTNNLALFLKGAYTWFWGMEIANSNPDPPREEAGVNFASSEGNKLINVIIHDEGSNGINPYSQATNAEVYGCIVYYSGRFSDPEHMNAYAIYGQNIAPSTKKVSDNFLFNSFGIFQAHMAGSSSARIDNFTFEGNVFFGHTLNNGNNVIALLGNFETGAGKNLNPQWRFNVLYRADLWLGYNGDGVDSAVVVDNVFFRGDYEGNPFNTYSMMSGNEFFLSKDTVIVRPDRYADAREPRKANIVVLNARRSPTVRVDLPAGLLIAGERYQVRDVQNLYGAAAAEGVYADSAIVIAMADSGDPLTQPRSIPLERPGSSLPSHTDREFGAFVLLADVKADTWPLGVASPPVGDDFLLAQNYPNPFNGTTTIRFALPVRNHVRLSVCNILGQEVATVTEGVYEAGEHTAAFDGSGLASGVYFYRISAGLFASVRKLLLIR